MVKFKAEKKIITIYIILSFIWIIISDKFINIIVKKPELTSTYQTIKGWIYVLVTAVIFYLILHRFIVSLREKNQQLQDYVIELEKVNRKVNNLNQELKESYDKNN